MNKTEIYEKLNEIFRDVFDDETIAVSESTTSADVDGWDSLTHISLIAACEDEFDIRFDMKAIQGLKNVGELADTIAAYLK